MKRSIMTALAVLVLGSTALPGCLYVGPWWWGPDHDAYWEGRHYYREGPRRHGKLSPPDEGRGGHKEDARRSGSDRDAG